MNYGCIEFVYKKTSGRCGFPGCLESDNLDIHHMVPKGRGGSDNKENLILLCRNHYTMLPNSVHRCNESLRIIQNMYISDLSKCIANRQERAERKRSRAGINKTMSNRRKSLYSYAKAVKSKSKCVQDKNIEYFRERLRLGCSRKQ